MNDTFMKMSVLVIFFAATAFPSYHMGKSAGIRDAVYPPPKVETLADALHHQEAKIARWLDKNGCVFPAVWARACMNTSDAELCAVMVQKESNGRTDLGVGPAGEMGPFRIIPRYWSHLVGTPSNDPYVAAMQHDLIMLELQETRSLASAISAYNGHGGGYVVDTWTKYRELGGGTF